MISSTSPRSAISNGSDLFGTVVRSDGPIPGPLRRDPWKAATALVLLLALLPAVVAFWIATLPLRLALRALGFGPRRGGGLFAEIFVFHVLGSVFRPGDPVPLYHYVVETAQGHRTVRQEGELSEGRIFVGNRVRISGRLRRGTLLLRDGFNETLGARLALPGSPWRFLFPAVLFLTAVGYLLLLAAAG